MMKYYKIAEPDLMELLETTARYECLETGGVDNWEWYMENRTEYIANCLDRTEEEVEENDLDFEDVANKWLKDYERIETE